MKTGTTTLLARAALRAAAVAATLACSSGLSLAADATLSIDWFGVSAEQYSGAYVSSSNPYQSFAMTAIDGGSAAIKNNYAALDWLQGPNYVAQSSNAMATGNTVQFTDVATQLGTGGVNLAATAQQTGALPNVGSAASTQAGAFTLVDAFGEAVAGTITFDVYYGLGVSPPVGASTGNYARSALSLVISDANVTKSFSDGLLSSALAGGTGSTSGHFSWTLNLLAGETATYALNTSAIAVAVPEPSSYALLGAGLVAVGAVARRRRKLMSS